VAKDINNLSFKTKSMSAKITWCNVDRLFYVHHNDEIIHHQRTKPNDTEIIEALISDRWAERFEDMRNGERVRVSERIYWEMLGSVPPIKQTANSFYCGEAYSGSYHHFFEKVNGYCYGQLKPLN
jgi:hypothetical protein